MYVFVLAVHNILRWVVLILAVIVLYRSFSGWLQKKAWTEIDRKAGIFFGAAVDLQLLLGLILYFALSPFGFQAFSGQGMAMVMSNAIFRFFAVEHLALMVLAVVFTHLGSILPKKVQDSVKKHQRAAVLFTLAVLMIILGIPWGRPLFPAF